MPSYYTFPGLKLSLLEPDQLENLKRQNQAFYQSQELIDQIRQCVCEYYDVTKSELEGKRGKYLLSWARHVFVFMLRKYTKLSLANIGEMLHRDHTTIIHSSREVAEQIGANTETRIQVLTIQNKIEDCIYITIRSSRPVNPAPGE